MASNVETQSSSGTRLGDGLWWATFATLGLVFCVHFLLLQLSNMPQSPLRLDVSDELNHYVNPYFSQRWSFFAPQPPEHDTLLAARARYRDSAGREVTTPWSDITSPLLEAVRKDRLTPIFLVELGLSNAVIDYENYVGTDPKASFEKDGKKYLLPVIPAAVDPVDLLLMTRTALASLELQLPGRRLDGVQLGLIHYEYPRFTARHAPPSAPKQLPMTLVEWQPAVPVAPFSLPRQAPADLPVAASPAFPR